MARRVPLSPRRPGRDLPPLGRGPFSIYTSINRGDVTKKTVDPIKKRHPTHADGAQMRLLIHLAVRLHAVGGSERLSRSTDEELSHLSGMTAFLGR